MLNQQTQYDLLPHQNNEGRGFKRAPTERLGFNKHGKFEFFLRRSDMAFNYR
jgi:hypothetical protein